MYALKRAKQYVKALSYFILKNEEGLKVACEEVVKISEVLIPYLMIAVDPSL